MAFWVPWIRVSWAPDNPFGMSPNDPAGNDDVLITSNELHLPIDRPVKLLLRSKDVLHNFAVPQFRVKMDLVPGMVTFVWLTPTRCWQVRPTVHGVVRYRALHDARLRRRRSATGL
jgi:heme/copper-type cytochrome/quinol oxidase subunit 2